MDREILVYADWLDSSPVLIGTLYSSSGKGKEVFSFEYSPLWLEEHSGVFLDPDLYPFRGRQFLPSGKEIFGLFSDSSPDRWGRVLMKRRESENAKRENRSIRRLTALDFLLGVDDASRMGGLRFRERSDGPFLSDSRTPVPVWTSLRELESASLALESDEGTEREIEEYLELLFAPGSSLGGARPKASVVAPDSSLWMAKFPSRSDERDIGAWEMVCHTLASLCGLDVVDAKCEKFSRNGSTFLTKRFDRNGGKRIHFMSALTALGRTDGSSASDGSSYLDIAEVIRMYSTRPGKDLEELWKRIVFSICVTNTDDHLRNHGFLISGDSFALSPLYDVNPSEYGGALSLNIDEDSNALDLDTAIDAARYYGLEKDEAASLSKSIAETVSSHWRRLASLYGISRTETAEMERCFIS